MTTTEQDTTEVSGSGPASPFYKDATSLCKIGKDADLYFLNTPHGVIPPPIVTAHFDSV